MRNHSRMRSEAVPLRPTRMILAMVLLAAGTGRSVAADAPFGDAIAVWHMADLNDAAGKNSPLVAKGNVKCGIQLEGAEREASLRRGGDGCVAQFDGGWLDAGQGAEGELNLTGQAMTMALRLRSPSGTWGCPLMAKHGGARQGSLQHLLHRSGRRRGVRGRTRQRRVSRHAPGQDSHCPIGTDRLA